MAVLTDERKERLLELYSEALSDNVDSPEDGMRHIAFPGDLTFCGKPAESAEYLHYRPMCEDCRAVQAELSRANEALRIRYFWVLKEQA
jgi:hypothetical protein